MARVLVSALAVRAPLGGYLATILQWVLGAHRLGHDVYLVEKPGWPNSCYDPSIGQLSSDGTYGIAAVRALFERFGLGDRWCYVDEQARYHGLSKARVDELFRTADIFVDLSADALGEAAYTWADQAQHVRLRVFVDGEPGHYQHRLTKAWSEHPDHPMFDRYYTVGLNVGSSASSVPLVGQEWHHTAYPVLPDLFPATLPPADAPFTTVMTWHAHDPVKFAQSGYGQKDVEFAKFMELPRNTSINLEVAVGGGNVPRAVLRENGWQVSSAQDATITYDEYLAFIRRSRGEFTVAKNVYVATNSGWFGDRSGVYLAHGRPVVMQETGISAHLPCGKGLITVRTVEEAAMAMDDVAGNYVEHSAMARTIAEEYLSAPVVLGRFFAELGL